MLGLKLNHVSKRGPCFLHQSVHITKPKHITIISIFHEIHHTLHEMQISVIYWSASMLHNAEIFFPWELCSWEICLLRDDEILLYHGICYVCSWVLREHSGYGISQWQTALLCNIVSHWLSPCTVWCQGSGKYWWGGGGGGGCLHGK